MKEIYHVPIVEIIILEDENIVRTSIDTDTPAGTGGETAW